MRVYLVLSLRFHCAKTNLSCQYLAQVPEHVQGKKLRVLLWDLCVMKTYFSKMLTKFKVLAHMVGCQCSSC